MGSLSPLNVAVELWGTWRQDVETHATLLASGLELGHEPAYRQAGSEPPSTWIALTGKGERSFKAVRKWAAVRAVATE